MLKRNLKASICRLCLNTKFDVDSEVVEVIKEIVEIAWPKLNLEKGDKHLICNSCSGKLFAAFDFKSVCTDTEDTIFPYVNSQETPLVDLREIYLKEKGDIKSIDILENHKICRLCLQSVGYGFVSLNEVDADIIDNYIPEVNFNATKDPVICKLCSDSLVTHGTFLSSCFAAQEENRNVCGSPTEDRECCIKIEETKIEDDWERKVCGDPAEDRECCIKTEEIKSYQLRHEDAETIGNFKGRCNSKNIPVKKRKVTYTCNRCNFKTVRKYSLKRHCLTHVSLTTTYISPKSQCQSESSDASSPCPLKGQVRMFQCEKCPYRTHLKDTFACHWSTHEVPSEVKVYQCEICHYRVTREDHFRRHQLRHEDSAETIENFKSRLSFENIRIKKKKVTHTCNQCDFKTMYKGNLTRHFLKHKVSPTPTYISPKSQCKSKSRDVLLPCTLKRQERMYQCEKCPYRTPVKDAFISHWLTHKVPSEVKVYQCDKCHYRVTQKKHFRSHQLKHQDGGIIEKYTCDKCDFQTRYKCSLVTHQLLHKKEKRKDVKCHTGDDGEPMYKCNVCKYETKNRRQLLVHRCHQVSPTKQLKFKCHMCAFQSIKKGSLTRHQLTHSLEAKTYKCDVCFFQTIWKTNLIHHQLRHRKKCEVKTYDCFKCSFSTRYKESLKVHVLKHSALE